MIGSSVGPYQIVDKLGAGGMGEVFLGHDSRLQRRVALKCLAAAPAAAESDRILREARAVARLNHPNIAAVYDILEQDDRRFIVMEYVEGESLSARLRRGAPSAAEIRSVGRQLASALAAAHAQGVVHRDLKPANVMIARDGTIKVLDFGVAKLSAPAASTKDATGLAILDSTLAGNPGTPVYMSPEQLFDRPIDGRSDLYSAGVILYEMSTGRRPYSETGAVALALAMSKAPPPYPRSIVPSIPADLEVVIMRALERDPERRFQSAQEFEQALAVTTAVVAPVSGPSGGFFTGSRARRIGIPAIAVVALLIAWAYASLRQRNATVAGTTTPPRRAVAVLPLENLSGDESKAYIGAGVAETLTMALSKAPGLTVLSRSEVLEALRRDRDVRRVARDLDVSFIVDGSVQKAGDRLRITLRVVRGDGTVAWSDAYEDDTAAIFAMHRVMAADLVGRMEGRVPAATDVTVPTTANVEVLMAYWQARDLLDRAASAADFVAVVARFQETISHDPKFALGYAGLADTLWQQYQVTHDPALPPLALDAGLTALRLDPTQPATRVAVATVYQGLGQYDAAVDQLRRALELQPSNDDAHRILARVLAAQGKPDQAIGELQQAIEYRPRRWTNYNALGGLYFQVRRLPEAAATFQRALEIAPNDARTYLSLGAVYVEMGDLSRAIEMFDRSATITPTGLALSNKGTAYYRLGRFDDAANAYEAAVRLEGKSSLFHGNLGDAYVRLNRRTDAIREFTAARELALAALRVNEKDARMMARAAAFEAKLGLKSAAVEHAAQAAALAPRDPDVQYKRAVVGALLGDPATALRALNEALTLGFKAEDVRNDYDLAALRNLPEFNALLGGHR